MSSWAIGLVMGVAALVGYYNSAGPRRRRLRARPFPAEWQAILEKNLALYRRLPEDLKSQLHSSILVFFGREELRGLRRPDRDR